MSTEENRIVEFPFDEGPLSALLDEFSCDCGSSLSTVPSIGPTAYLSVSPMHFFEFYTEPQKGDDATAASTATPYDEPPLSPTLTQTSMSISSDEGVEAFVPVSPTSALDVRLILTTEDQRKEIVKPKLNLQRFGGHGAKHADDVVSMDMEWSDDEEEELEEHDTEPLGLSFLDEEDHSHGISETPQRPALEV